MKRIWMLVVVMMFSTFGSFAGEVEEQNKALARRFYEEVWFKNNPAVVDEIVAPTYIAHDIGERKNSMEPAEEQKKIAQFFWERGTMTGTIDYQIAEGDLVATRWQWYFKPNVWWMKILGGEEHIPIINVFRIRDGKIVEVWNHRHDIDTGMGNFLFIKGLALGLLPSLALLALLFVVWRRARHSQPTPETKTEPSKGLRSSILLLGAVLSVTTLIPDIAGQTTPKYVIATVIKTPPVSLPKEAKESGLGGEVRVGVTINSEGKVIEVGDARGPGFVCKQAARADVIALRAAAREAALSAVFEPSTVDGRPDPATSTVRFNFPVEERKTDSENEVRYFSAVGEGENSGDSRGILNGKALSLPKPPYPPAARAVRASGAVQVQVLIDETGNMFSAEPVSGHPLLRHAASTAACSAQFTPTLLDGKPVRVAGIITYNFVP